MRNYFLLFIVFTILSSCSFNNSENRNIIKKNYKENLRVYLYNNYNPLRNSTEINKIALHNVNLINDFYRGIKHTPIWINDSLILNKNAIEFIRLLASSYNYGLDTSFYYANSLKKINKSLINISKKEDRYQLAAELEILLTNSYFLFAKDLNYGIVSKDSSLLVSKIPRKEFSIDFSQQLLKSFKTDSLTSKLLSLQPSHPEYIKLQQHLEKYLKTASLSRDSVKVESFRKDSLKAYEQSKKALILYNYFSENSTDSTYFKALTKFQVQHGLKPDSLIGQNTAKALSQSPYSDYNKIIMSLEKWRWQKNWNANYIYVNIPSYEMKIYQDNKIIKHLKVVVGKPKNHTPEINDEMEYMIVYPFWNLPYSISSKELLPKIKKDSSYLKRNGYKVFSNKHKSIKSDEIDWSTITEENFDYKIRQNGGRSNSLGLIKFIFPNKNSVYFHDTPSKRYFKNDIRAYSHGCVRVQHPLQLADIILKSDNNKYNIDSVNVFINNKKNHRISLNTKIPVHIQYFTSGVDSNNNLVFYKDIYKWDTKLEELMNLAIKSHSINTPKAIPF